MKRIFGPELLENVSSEIQALLQREERKIRLRMIKKKSKMSHKYSIMGSFFESARKSQKSIAVKRHSVNPIITILFVGMALKTWKRFAQRKINGELLTNDSLPYVGEEEDSYEEEVESISENDDSSSSDSSSSFSPRMNRRNAEKDESRSISEEKVSESEEERNEYNEKSEKSRSSSSSGSSMKSDDLNRCQREEEQRGRRMGRFSQIDLIKGFLWNKIDGAKDEKRSTNIFVNFLSLHKNLRQSEITKKISSPKNIPSTTVIPSIKNIPSTKNIRSSRNILSSANIPSIKKIPSIKNNKN